MGKQGNQIIYYFIQKIFETYLDFRTFSVYFFKMFLHLWWLEDYVNLSGLGCIEHEIKQIWLIMKLYNTFLDHMNMWQIVTHKLFNCFYLCLKTLISQNNVSSTQVLSHKGWLSHTNRFLLRMKIFQQNIIASNGLDVFRYLGVISFLSKVDVCRKSICLL